MGATSWRTAPAVLVCLTLVWLTAAAPATGAYEPALSATASPTFDPSANQVVSPGGANLGEYAFNDYIRTAAVDPSTGITYVGGNFTQVGIRTGEVAAVEPPGSGSDELAGSSPGVLGNQITAFEDDASGYFLTGNITSVGGDGVRRMRPTRMAADGTVDASWSVSGPCSSQVRDPQWDLGDRLAAMTELSGDGSGLSTVGVAFIDKASGEQTIVGGGSDPCAASTRIWPSIPAFPPLADCQGWLTCIGYVEDVAVDQSALMLVTETSVISQEAAGSDQHVRNYIVGYDMGTGSRAWWTDLQSPAGSSLYSHQGRETRMVGLGGALLAAGYFPLEPDLGTLSTMLLLDDTTGTILQRWNAAGEQDTASPATTLGPADDCTPADNGWGDNINWSFARLGSSSAIGYGSWTEGPGYRPISVCDYGVSGSGTAARLVTSKRGTLDAIPDSGFIYGLPSTLYADGYLVGGFGAFDLQTNTQVTSWNPSPSTAPQSVIAVGSTVVLAGSSGGDDFVFIHGSPASHVAALGADLSPISSFEAQLPDTSRSADGMQDVRAIRVDGDDLLVAGDLKGPFGRAPVLALKAATGSLDWAHAESDGTVGWALAVDETNGAFYLGTERFENPNLLTRFSQEPGGFSIDTSFHHLVGPIQATDSFALITALAYVNGRLYVGGTFGSIDGHARQGLARLGVDGSLDPWAPALLDELDAPSGASVDVQPRAFVESDGSVGVSGGFDWYPSGGGQVTVMSSVLVYDASTGARVRPAGTNDVWFPGSCPSSASDMIKVDGVIYVAMGCNGLYAFDPATFDFLPDLSFQTEFNGVDSVNALVALPVSPTTAAMETPSSSSTLVIAGFLPRWGNQPAGNVVALSPKTASAPDAPTNVVATAGNGRATVTWTAPVSDGGASVTSYTVTSSPGAKTCTTPDGTTLSCVVTGLTNGTPYSFTVRATNSVGTGPASASSAKVTPTASDVIPPLVYPPTVAILVGHASGSTTKVRVSWPAATDASGIHSYKLQKSSDGGSWRTVSLSGRTARSVDLSLAVGHGYRFRLAATDGSPRRNSSAYVVTATNRFARIQETGSAIAYSGSWKRVHMSGASGSYVKDTMAASSRATFSFSGTSVAWVSTQGPARGIAAVWLDGAKIATVDLYAGSLAKKRVVWTSGTIAPGTHSVEIRVTGSKSAHSSSAQVDVDAFLTWS